MAVKASCQARSAVEAWRLNHFAGEMETDVGWNFGRLHARCILAGVGLCEGLRAAQGRPPVILNAILLLISLLLLVYLVYALLRPEKF